MERVFLDANVLFSAAWRPDAGLAGFWRVRGVTLLASAFVLEEARVNLETDEQRDRLAALAAELEIVPEPMDEPEALAGVKLPPKDRPVLIAAARGKADVLVTGDTRHFGPYFGKRIAGVLVLTPASYFERLRGR